MPPATATLRSPALIAWAASMTVFRPEPHTLLMVTAEQASGMPAARRLCRAGFWPRPACSTLPMSTSSTSAAGTFARRRASATARPPSCGAVKEARAPWNLAIGVRQAETMTGRPMVRGSSTRISKGFWRGNPSHARGPDQPPGAGPPGRVSRRRLGAKILGSAQSSGQRQSAGIPRRFRQLSTWTHASRLGPPKVNRPKSQPARRTLRVGQAG